ncbi:MAG: acyl-[acyl-carrier-protein]--UDP-N-acetylglucosamine O-acyltransferase [Acidobacteria bacterium]|nr:MAG: acyl-[acyl-carrier-protein]--UDP-N-acetylglucosamine O-acyltransferase [Acidobacteriota bacterium]
MIHPTAIIGQNVEISESATIGPFCVIGDHVRIGDATTLKSSIQIDSHTILGKNNTIYPFCCLGFPPQDVKYHGEPTETIIGDENIIRENSTIHRGTKTGRAKTLLGSGNFLMAYSHIAHDCQVGDHNIFVNAATLGGHVTVGNHVYIGAYSGVHQFCRIGDHAFVGGYSVITQDALPFVKTVGNRAKTYDVNTMGLERKGFRPEVVTALKKAYRILLRRKLQLADALTEMRKEFPDIAEVQYFADFIEQSERGICR